MLDGVWKEANLSKCNSFDAFRWEEEISESNKGIQRNQVQVVYIKTGTPMLNCMIDERG